jgi:hypothetical protein
MSNQLSPRNAHYYECDDKNMQIVQVGREFFLDKWAGGGWKNISVFKTYDAALKARSEIREMGVQLCINELTRGEK